MDENYYNQFEGYLNTFCSNLKSQINKIIQEKEDTNGKVVVCAIARKAPKLLDYLHDRLDDVWDKMYVVTEIALPFLKWGDIRQIILIDDAIYYGSTVEGVYAKIQKFSDAVKIVPICCISATDSHLSFEKELKSESVERSVGHYFVDCLSGRFQTLLSPFEVEFPVLTIQYPDGKVFDSARFMQDIMGYGIGHVYYISDKEWGIDMSDNGKECKKIRLYFHKQKILLSCICTTPVFDDVLLDNNLFNNTIYASIWHNAIRKGLAGCSDEDSRGKALCIAFNFLYSLAEFSKVWATIKKGIESQFENEFVTIRFSEREPCLLFTDDVSKPMVQWADDFLAISTIASTDSFTEYEVDSFDVDKEVLPGTFEFSELYFSQQKKYLESFDKPELVLMSLFYLQNTMLDKLNRAFYMLNNERLKYGHSFSTLGSLFDRKGIKGYRSKMHSWVDQNIDRASIVPQYLKVTNSDRKSVWTRVFRSGENEMLFVSKWGRLVLHVLDSEIRKSGMESIPRSYLSSLIVYVHRKVGLKDCGFEVQNIQRINHTYTTYIKIGNETVEILDLMKKLDIILEDEANIIRIDEESLDNELLSGLSLPIDKTEEIDNLLSYVHDSISDIWMNFKYIPFFDHELYDGVASSGNYDALSNLFDFMKKHVAKEDVVKNWKGYLERIWKEFLAAKYENSSLKKEWGNIEVDVLDDEIESLLKTACKTREKLLLDIITFACYDSTGKILIDFLKRKKIAALNYIEGVASNMPFDANSIFSKIINKGINQWPHI